MNSSFYKNLLDQSWRSRGLHKKIYAGLPHGQKKPKKFKKSGKNRDFEKIQENFFKKHQIFKTKDCFTISKCLLHFLTNLIQIFTEIPLLRFKLIKYEIFKFEK